ncbi:UPF0314 protein BBta_0150-like [Folsomia candida]|uniref:UPF0314 protein BBta_0150-like n=1 Tax=Folsomia candida TaxID=158441 RepID=UPI001604E6AB|nr:UPF0314 protein BBta_0150-like [Folsomia candida]
MKRETLVIFWLVSTCYTIPGISGRRLCEGHFLHGNCVIPSNETIGENEVLFVKTKKNDKVLERYEDAFPHWDDLKFGFAISSIFMLQAFTLHAMGQPLVSPNGPVMLWDGDIFGAQNSQQLTDWYTFTHVLHGFLLYHASGLVPVVNTSVRSRFLFALGAEAGWEMLENSPFIIERYRQTALAQGYSGDSMVNSLCDTVAMSFGFVLASKLHPLTIFGLFVAEEVIMGAIIRDNLSLNVIQLIYPIDSIQKWQTGLRNPEISVINSTTLL